MKTLRIVLAGNPNSGKTTIFNHLTGARQHVGNYGGVTVDIAEGAVEADGTTVQLVDLPGTYSLSAYSLEEKVARDYIVDEAPDAVINVIDATNLERNLYFTVQLLELGVRPILALNMWDEVAEKGITIDTAALGTLLGLRIVTTVGKTGTGVGELLAAAIEECRGDQTAHQGLVENMPEELSQAIAHIAGNRTLDGVAKYPRRWLAVKLFEGDTQIRDIVAALPGGPELLVTCTSQAAEIERVLGDDAQSLVAEARYGFVAGAVRATVRRRPRRREMTDRIDAVLTHPFWAYPIFIGFMWLLFQATFTLGRYPMDWIESFFGVLAVAAARLLPAGPLESLVVDGIIGGVGGVMVFLPNIMILFFGIAIMEDTGYMARTAFIMDKVMHSIGLHGKSFIPMLIGMGCNVPAIMATRTLESERDRIKTILLAPLISCSARMPVYVLFAGALFPKHAGNIVFLFQFGLGTLAFFFMATIFKKTLFRGQDKPFVMELPPYRLPTGRSVTIHMWHRARHYLKKMGGVVLVFSVILWVLGAYPRSAAIDERFDELVLQVHSDRSLTPGEAHERVGSLEVQRQSEQVAQSVIGRTGRLIEPLVRPLGFDWRGAVSLLTGFVAKEIVVSSMGVLYAVGHEEDAESESLKAKIAEHFTPLTALAFMLFVLLYTPCVVALVTVVRELRNWKWSAFAVAYQVAFAWLAAFVVYQGGRVLGLH